ncbi:heterokaryon incompatibility protein-domain-containing protein [Truncatella angustata]|uniref:Heterokaryon incompatibility protein-domain-containing protein n=1 Tax=Truncatella angustata TaxID=152316 RepID=A0A9P8UH15_9PEZI|nr:heterokaryon incompatibility protein-domain-containing protein [Truncatella angustata]KAH6651998.1 heterokaryon incompatibility protein-domain-containing protein [Truncatella angustata]KAH8205719.1 hypothetical protein TruAng_000213 [Truncatella angustata]
MPSFTFAPPIAKGDNIDGFYHLPEIEGVSIDEVKRMEALSFWTCGNCSSSSPVTERFFACGSKAHGSTYILCQKCRDSGESCDPHPSQHELVLCQAKLEHNMAHYYQRTPVPPRHIRLLHIRPSQNFEDPLEGMVSVASVDDPLEYHTLSYVWGSPIKPKLIKIGHCLVAITYSLELALRRCRDGKGDVAIWADAICINQADNAEKAAQISMMRDIYKNSLKTYVYLGENEENLRIELLTEENRMRLHEATRKDQLQANEAMGSLLEQNWFSRVWVVQEVAASLQCIVLFGDVSFDYKLLIDHVEITSHTPFRTVLLQIRQIREIAKNFKPAHMANARRFWLEKQFGNNLEKQRQFRKIEEAFEERFRPFPYPLIDLLESFRNRDATDPRDKIYAFLGLATDIKWEHDGEIAKISSSTGCQVPEPDYNSSIQDVYYNYACYFVDSGYWCDMLHSASLNNLGSSRLPELPSWVPDWTSRRENVQSKRFNEHFGQYLYHAGGFNGLTKARVKPESRILAISGGLVDKITFLAEPWKFGEPRHPDIMACMNLLINNKAYCRKAATEGFEPLTIRDALIYNCVDQVMECEDCVAGAPVWLQSIAVATTFKYTRHRDVL